MGEVLKMSKRLIAALVLSCSPLATAYAQTADAPKPTMPETEETSEEKGITEIIVTAQKRSESLQKVPLAITAITSENLERSGITDLQGIVSNVPNLNLGAQLGFAKVALRGIGLENISAGAEGSIAFHMDGVFLSRTITALASFYDVEQIEVLRGPQGTLYGRNATGGAINITTRKPTEELSGYFKLTGGNYGRITTEGAVSGAIVPGKLSARIAFQMQNRDGYGKNIATGNNIDDLNTRAIRATLRFTPGDAATIDLTADYFRQKDRGGGYHITGTGGFTAPGVPIIPDGILLGDRFAPNLRDINNTTDPNNFARFWGLTGKSTFDLSDNVQLMSLTSYRSTFNDTKTDLDGVALFLVRQFQFERAKQFSQEVQLSGSGDRLTWLLGGYYFRETTNGTQANPFNPGLTLSPFLPNQISAGYLGSGFIKTRALAGFGQASYEVVDNLRLTLGARYSWEKKINQDRFAFDLFTPYNGRDLAVPQFILGPRDKTFKSFTPRIALDYQAMPDTLLYASWAKGFKAGTYSLGSLTNPVDPEKINAFEAGVKTSFMDRRVRLNIAGFYYDYKDLQIGKVVGTTQATLVLENAATAKIYGLEAELTAQVTDNFEVNANASWLHARFNDYVSADPARAFGDGRTFVDANGNFLPGVTSTSPCLLALPAPTCAPAFNLKGNSLSQAPDFTVFVGAQYTIPSRLGEFKLRGEMSWRDRVYFTPFNLDYVSQAPNTRFNAFINWTSNDDQWTGQLFMKNIGNKTVVGNAGVSTGIIGFPLNGYLEDPRTYGVTLGYKF
jgi:iron complex outermembrane recepter protein